MNNFDFKECVLLILFEIILLCLNIMEPIIVCIVFQLVLLIDWGLACENLEFKDSIGDVPVIVNC